MTQPIANPARPDEIVGYAAIADGEQVDNAIVTARSAWFTWSAEGFDRRIELMTVALDGVDSVRDKVAELLTKEIGKPLLESRIDTWVFDKRWKLALEAAGEFPLEEMLPQADGAENITVVQRQALGVVTIIVPFNWPLAILAASLPHALVTGNTVIVKVPESAPLGMSLYLSTIAERLPAGVLTVISGTNDVVEPLITDPRIAKVCFTGSVSAGKYIMRLASSSLTRVTLELGGNDPAIICADADLSDSQVDKLFSSIFDTAGQICMNVKRIYVHRTRKEELLRKLRARLEAVVLGDGLDESTTMGPLHSAKQRDFAEDIIAEARAAGATVERFGTLPSGSLSDGNFVLPTLIIDPPHSTRIVTDEQFAPVIPIIEFENVDDAVHWANDNWSGLGASIWTEDESVATTIARRLEVGYVWVNDHGAPRLDLRAPFGGMKQSGFGREQGIAGLEDFTDTRAVSRPRKQ